MTTQQQQPEVQVQMMQQQQQQKAHGDGVGQQEHLCICFLVDPTAYAADDTTHTNPSCYKYVGPRAPIDDLLDMGI